MSQHTDVVSSGGANSLFSQTSGALGRDAAEKIPDDINTNYDAARGLAFLFWTYPYEILRRGRDHVLTIADMNPLSNADSSFEAGNALYHAWCTEKQATALRNRTAVAAACERVRQRQAAAFGVSVAAPALLPPVRHTLSGLTVSVSAASDSICPPSASQAGATEPEAACVTEELELESPSFFRAIVGAFGLGYLKVGSWLVLYTGAKIAMILFLREVLLYLRDETGEDPQWKGFMWALLMVLAQLIQVTCHHHYFFLGPRLGQRARVGSCSLIYAKALSLHAAAFTQTSTGQAVNLISNDPYRFDDAGPFLHYLWNAPVEGAVIFYLIYRQVGTALFPGLAVMLFFVFAQASFSSCFGRIRASTIVHTDARVKAVSEILMGTEIIKMYNWEEPLEERVETERRAEVSSIAWNVFLKSINLACYFAVLIIVTLVTFTTYAAQGNELTAESVFTTTSFYAQITMPLVNFIPVAAEKMFEILIATRRMTRFMLLEEDLLSDDLTFDRATIYTASQRGQKQARGHGATAESASSAAELATLGAAAVAAAASAAAPDEEGDDEEAKANTVAASTSAIAPAPARGSVRIPGDSFAWPDEPTTGVVAGRGSTPALSRSQSTVPGANGFVRLGSSAGANAHTSSTTVPSSGVASAASAPGPASAAAAAAALYAAGASANNGPSMAPELTRALSAQTHHQTLFVSSDSSASGAVSPATATAAVAAPTDDAFPLASAPVATAVGLRHGLHDIDLTIPAGKLAVIVGTVGSYKSSLLHALLGEMPRTGMGARADAGVSAAVSPNRHGEHVSESPYIAGKIAYASQKPWIFAASVRDNILFGSAFDPVRYERVVHACALTRDLTLLPQGDATVIGERGATLSGGQRARVALARACYAENADVVVLDDVLAAVDPVVAQHIFAKCLGPNGILNSQTRIVVSHQAAVLPNADMIIVMYRGRVAFKGSFPELKAAAVVAKEAQACRLTRRLSSRHDAAVAANAVLRSETVSIDNVTEDGNPFHTVTYLKSHPVSGDALATAVSPDALLALGSDEDEDADGDDDGHGGSLNCLVPFADIGGEGLKDDQEEVEVVEAPVVVAPESGAADKADSKKKDGATSVFSTEKSSQGTIKSSVFRDYFLGFASNSSDDTSVSWSTIFVVIGVTISMLAAPAVKVATDFWLSDWVAASFEDQQKHKFRNVFIVLSLVTIVFGYVRAVWFMNTVLRSAAAAHAKMFAGILYSPMSFFHENPVGRVLNRFSKDQSTLDELLPGTLFDFVQLLLSVVCTIVVVGIVAPYVLVLVALILPLYFWMRAVYIVSSREIKRLEGTTRSPVLALFSSSISGGGLTVLRAYNMQRSFQHAFHALLDENSRVLYAFLYTSRWLGLRLDLMSVILTLGTALICVGVRGGAGGIGMTPAAAGLALSYVMTVAAQFQWMTRQSTEVENQMTCAERVLEYASLPCEGVRYGALPLPESAPAAVGSSANMAAHAQTAAIEMVPLQSAPSSVGADGIDGVDRALSSCELVSVGEAGASACSNRSVAYKPPVSWPEAGRIDVRDVYMSYKPGVLPPVLRGLTFTLFPRQKVGVCGRTGAGKSSLFSVLFRLHGIQSGSVSVDGVDIHSIGLADLRSQVAIIPQNPVIFSGTVRYNLDPFGTWTDDQLWGALEKVQLKPHFLSQPLGLESPMAESGGNLSAGQGQLLCIARALLRPSRVLFVDEATANVDPQTDQVIQRVLRTAFKERTVVTIAHRLDTIADCDVIMVMDAGRVIEMGTPEELKATENGVFASMVALQQGEGAH
jgi:ABC-type multidrug transport system fused ATPase/permease subunit